MSAVYRHRYMMSCKVKTNQAPDGHVYTGILYRECTILNILRQKCRNDLLLPGDKRSIKVMFHGLPEVTCRLICIVLLTYKIINHYDYPLKLEFDQILLFGSNLRKLKFSLMV